MHYLINYAFIYALFNEFMQLFMYYWIDFLHYLINLCNDLCMHIIRRFIGSDRFFKTRFRSDPTERNFGQNWVRRRETDRLPTDFRSDAATLHINEIKNQQFDENDLENILNNLIQNSAILAKTNETDVTVKKKRQGNRGWKKQTNETKWIRLNAKSIF